MYIYSKYITRNGVRIYHPTGVFKFWVDDNKE
jgi:hypothetical protein|nr:MAG TPA: Protein pellino-like protein [Caudoviricetes sp.]